MRGVAPGAVVFGASAAPVLPLFKRLRFRFFDLLSSSLEEATGLRGSGREG